MHVVIYWVAFTFTVGLFIWFVIGGLLSQKHSKDTDKESQCAIDANREVVDTRQNIILVFTKKDERKLFLNLLEQKELDIPGRVKDALRQNKVSTVLHLLEMGRRKLLKTRNFGKKSIGFLDDFMSKIKLSEHWRKS